MNQFNTLEVAPSSALLLAIANKFNNYFTNISQTIAESIQYKGNKTYDYYLNTQVKSVFKFKNVNEETVRKTINDLLTKNSSGFDGISSKFLKIIEPAIIKSLTLIINQVINTGIFPDKLKIAKVIPILKNDDPTLFNNYRPISLLLRENHPQSVICLFY